MTLVINNIAADTNLYKNKIVNQIAWAKKMRLII